MARSVTLPQWVTEAAEKTPRPELVYNQPPKPSAYLIDRYESDAFIADIIEVCERHNLWISADHASLMISRTNTKHLILDALTND